MKQLWQKSLVRGLAVMGMAGALLGCTNVDSASPKGTAEVQAKAVSPESSTEDFTTVGKPTKTIETPWGAKEIYDPVQDIMVRDAFGRFYNKKYNSPHLYLNEWARKKLGDSDANLIFVAKNIHETDVMRLGCKFLKNYNCGGQLYFQDLIHPDRWRKCLYLNNLGKIRTECEKIFMQPSFRSSQTTCSINGKLRPDMGKYPIGNNTALTDPYTTNYIKPLTENLDWETQLEDFFSFECREWR